MIKKTNFLSVNMSRIVRVTLQFLLLNLVNNVYGLNTFYTTWMKDMSNNELYYGFDLYNKTIFDIILPGSHKSGMNNIETITQSMSDPYYNQISSLTNANKILWSQTQTNTVLNQLILGSRFIDLTLEYNTNNNNYYAYNGIFGNDIQTIVDDINLFITNYGPGM